MSLFDRFRRKRPVPRIEGRIEFLWEQDGQTEGRVKAALVREFASRLDVQRAYLVRAGFQPKDPTAVALCMCVTGSDQKRIVERIGEIAREQLPRSMFFDVLFLTPEQEAEVSAVCQPFYIASS